MYISEEEARDLIVKNGMEPCTMPVTKTVFYVTSDGSLCISFNPQADSKPAWSIRAFHDDSTGRLQCTIRRRKQGVVERAALHRIVFGAFANGGKYELPSGYDVDHIAESNPHDNRIENLQMLTRAENIKKWWASVDHAEHGKKVGCALREHYKHFKSKNVGRHHTDETRKKMSDAARGEKNHMYGKSPSEETRKKLSESLRTSEKAKAARQSKELRKKLSEKLSGANNPMYGKRGAATSAYGSGRTYSVIDTQTNLTIMSKTFYSDVVAYFNDTKLDPSKYAKRKNRYKKRFLITFD